MGDAPSVSTVQTVCFSSITNVYISVLRYQPVKCRFSFVFFSFFPASGWNHRILVLHKKQSVNLLIFLLRRRNLFPVYLHIVKHQIHHIIHLYGFRCLFHLYIPQGDIIQFRFRQTVCMSATLSTRLHVTSSMQIFRKTVG